MLHLPTSEPLTFNHKLILWSDHFNGHVFSLLEDLVWYRGESGHLQQFSSHEIPLLVLVSSQMRVLPVKTISSAKYFHEVGKFFRPLQRSSVVDPDLVDPDLLIPNELASWIRIHTIYQRLEEIWQKSSTFHNFLWFFYLCIWQHIFSIATKCPHLYFAIQNRAKLLRPYFSGPHTCRSILEETVRRRIFWWLLGLFVGEHSKRVNRIIV